MIIIAIPSIANLAGLFRKGEGVFLRGLFFKTRFGEVFDCRGQVLDRIKQLSTTKAVQKRPSSSF